LVDWQNTLVLKKKKNYEWNVVGIGYLTNFYGDSHQKELNNEEEKSKAAPRHNQPIAWKSSSKLPVTS